MHAGTCWLTADAPAQVRKNPKFAKARLPVYSFEDLEDAVEHIRCGWRCSAAQQLATCVCKYPFA
jgi:hypothetical protein